MLSRINTRLRTKPQFPGPVELTGFSQTLQAYGLRRVEDAAGALPLHGRHLGPTPS